MSDQIAARREARRRKILENSENRLKKITGRSESKIPISSTECSTEVKGSENDTKIERSSQENDTITQLSYLSMQSDLPSEYSKATEDISHSERPESYSHQTGSSLSLYISMAGLLRIFIEFNSGGICPHNIIVAFLMIKCGSVILHGVQPAENSPLVRGLSILSGISSKKLRIITLGFSFLASAFEHFALFTFSLVLSDIFLKIFNI